MKKTNFKVAVIAILVTSSFAAFSQENKKAEDARKDVKEAQQDLKEAKMDSAAEYQKFRKEAEMTINANDKKIAELKMKKASDKKEVNEEYAKKVQLLEKRNNALRQRLATSNTTKSTAWGSFKREFNHDMDELGHAIKDIGVDNAK